jgi:RHH-type rel operon transcriptional repressor/antitoxin RelB
MAISVRMDSLLEKELELTAKRMGLTKSQFIISAVERALGRKNPYELMVSLKAQEAAADSSVAQAFTGTEQAYNTDSSRDALIAKLKDKHSGSSAG